MRVIMAYLVLRQRKLYGAGCNEYRHNVYSSSVISRVIIQQLLYCCVCIRCRGNVFTEPLSRKDAGGGYTYRHIDSNVIS
jgi:hypothetical protein